MQRCTGTTVMLGCCLVLSACRNQPFEHIYDFERAAAHLRFEVTQPSKVDFLFVVDNSSSMSEEQAALETSFQSMLRVLAPTDVRYRIGMTSTGALGPLWNCCGGQLGATDPNDPTPRGNPGDCLRCTCAAGRDAPVCDVELRRPNDGARGRLISAYAPEVFDPAATGTDGAPLYPVPAEILPALNALFPNGVRQGPESANGLRGVPWVIDREVARLDACAACGCSVCDPLEEDPSGCFGDCAAPLGQALVTAYFVSNLRGLGTSGGGWEEGLRAALLAVGIDPDQQELNEAIDPPYALTRPGRPNSFPELEAPHEARSWVRHDALLAVMVVSDEEDCSMSDTVAESIETYERNAGVSESASCYLGDQVAPHHTPRRLAELLTVAKETRHRVAVGIIGGLEPDPNAEPQRSVAWATDCVSTAVDGDSVPVTDCSCLNDVPPEVEAAWCSYSQDSSGAGPACDALAAGRYLRFANRFDDPVLDSVCRAGPESFGPALAQFAERVIRACFQLNEVRPLGGQADMLWVERTPVGDDTRRLPRVEGPGSAPADGTPAWYYDAESNRACLLGLDRVIGDVYDIFVLHTEAP